MRARSQRGQTAVEFTLGVTVLVMLVLAVFQLGVIYYDHVTLEYAARDGAHHAAIQRTAAGLTQATAQSVALATVDDDAQGLNPGQITVTTTSSDAPGAVNGVFWERGDRVTVTVSYPWSINIIGVPLTSGTMTSSSTLSIE
jgi:Flp pilus assembly protein TadG